MSPALRLPGAKPGATIESPQRQRELAAELNALPVALIVAAQGTMPIRAARDAAPGLPVVMVRRRCCKSLVGS